MLDYNAVNPNTGLVYTETEIDIINEREKNQIKEIKESRKLRAVKSEILADIKTNARAAFIQEVGDDMVAIIKALKSQALGEAWVEKLDKLGNRVAVKAPMSVEAAIYMINQMIGKPTETVEHMGRVSLTMDD